MTDDTLTGPRTRWYVAQGGVSNRRIPVCYEEAMPWRPFFWTEEAAQAYCDWRNAGIDARKAEEAPEPTADLLAASWEMLDALKGAHDAISGKPTDLHSVVKAMEAAIAKAEGRGDHG